MVVFRDIATVDEIKNFHVSGPLTIQSHFTVISLYACTYVRSVSGVTLQTLP